MADTQQVDQPAGRQVNPGRVIGKLTQQVADQAQQLALLSAAVDELTEENDALRAELVAAPTAGGGGGGQAATLAPPAA